MDTYHYFKFNEANFRQGYWPSKWHKDIIWAEYENETTNQDRIHRHQSEQPEYSATLCKKCKIWYKSDTIHKCNPYINRKKLLSKIEETKVTIETNKIDNIKDERDTYFDGLFKKKLIKPDKEENERAENHCHWCNDSAKLHRHIRKASGKVFVRYSCGNHFEDLQEWRP